MAIWTLGSSTMPSHIKRSDLTTQTVGDETLILDLRSNRIHQLNTTAAFIWHHYASDATGEQLAARFAVEYGIDAASAAVDVERIVGQLHELDLLVPGEGVEKP